MEGINLWAVLASAVAAFAFAALWYSPILFLPSWMREAQVAEQLPQSPRIFAVAFLFTLIAAIAFAFILGPTPTLGTALTYGFIVGACIVAASMGVNYQFAGRSTRFWLIDGGFQVGRFMVMGLVLGLWY